MRYLSVLATFLLLSGCAHTHPQSHSDVAITSVPSHCLALLADGTAIVEIRNGPHGIVAFPVYGEHQPFRLHPDNIVFMPLDGTQGWHIALGHYMRAPYQAALGRSDSAQFEVYSDIAPGTDSPGRFVVRIRDTHGFVHESEPMTACRA